VLSPQAVCAIVVAGGSGTRFGGAKQFLPLSGRRVVDRSVEAARCVAGTVILVVPAESLDDPESKAVADVVVCGGPTRAASVRSGLAVLPPGVEVVVVHDAARPLATEELFLSVVAAVRQGAAGAVPGVPVADTIKRVSEGRVVETVERGELVAVQTPQAFRAEVLLRAHDGGGDATDDAGLLEALGEAVVVVPGDPRNLKLTSRDDLLMLEALASGVIG
jgi:2-C-methyl-D-erythritol 4-phosphate cytidylyltransferase